MNITIISGARPNFIKIAPIIHAIKEKHDLGLNINFRLVHTGQHYDKKMAEIFFDELDIPKPDINLGCGGGSQSEITASIMIHFEKDLLLHPTDLVLVVGDVTSTMACAIVAQKLHTKVAHVEGGIRSNDWSMPEEINRLVTDSITDYFFTTSLAANKHLLSCGHSEDKIFFVGNTMIDTLVKNRSSFRKPAIWDSLNLSPKEYIVITLHRPANVDEKFKFKELIEEIILRTRHLPLIFPVHPRTKKVINSLNISSPNLHIIEPLGYLEFNYLVEKSKAILTDSGGVTEEATYMDVPCITLRENTERPETITIGTNELIGTDPKAIKPIMQKLFSEKWKKGGIPELWDGNTSKRIVEHLINLFEV